MTTISATTVKELRELTGAGMMDCKRALQECDGDMEAARDWLRKKGQAIAEKKAARTAADGLISTHIDRDKNVGVILELNCETDFVARNDDFLAFLDELTKLIAEGGPGREGSVEELLASPDPRNTSQTMQDRVKEVTAKVAEKLEIGGFTRIQGTEDEYLHSYIHPPGKLGVLLVAKVGNAATKQNDKFRELCNDIALHIAAAAPECLNRAGLSSELLEKERELYRSQAREEGKPENIIDKIVEGRVSKYYSQVCLLEQAFVKDPDQTVQQLVDSVAKEVGDKIEITLFERMKVGA